MTYLLDGNVLVALAIHNHVHRERCLRWIGQIEHFATCPVTEGTLLRLHMALAEDTSAAAAWRTLEVYRTHPRHVFWPENFSYTDISPTRLSGHRQITDSWLAELAHRRHGKLATLDEALFALWPKVTLLIPV
ncbi:MAG: PIN domain-containing protein [Verrucomicrobiota bacterium]